MKVRIRYGTVLFPNGAELTGWITTATHRTHKGWDWFTNPVVSPDHSTAVIVGQDMVHNYRYRAGWLKYNKDVRPR